jgi:hypothetical protein
MTSVRAPAPPTSLRPDVIVRRLVDLNRAGFAGAEVF